MARMAEVNTGDRIDFPILMTADDVAEILRVSSRTVRRWGDDGHLEAVRLAGHSVRFTARSVTALIDSPTDESPAGEARLSSKPAGTGRNATRRL
jgi:excisionase family DNA binding protein